MRWLDVAMIVFVCTAANHMGLIEAIEKTIHVKFPIVNCCKCATFWCTLAYGIFHFSGIAIVATSFLASMCAVWLELLMGFVDTLYYKAYERIFDTTAVTTADRHESYTTTKDTGDTEDAVPEV